MPSLRPVLQVRGPVALMSLPYSLLSGSSGIGDAKLHDERTGDPNEFTHDYTTCQNELCVLCAAYLDGYNQG